MKSDYNGVTFGIRAAHIQKSKYIMRYSASVLANGKKILSAESLQIDYPKAPVLGRSVDLRNLKYVSRALRKKYEGRGFATALFMARLIYLLSKKFERILTNNLKEGRKCVMYTDLGFSIQTYPSEFQSPGDTPFCAKRSFSKGFVDAVSKNKQVKAFCKKFSSRSATVEDVLETFALLAYIIEKGKFEQEKDLIARIPTYVSNFKTRSLQ